MEKTTVLKGIDINCKPEKIFSFITDPKNIPLILPGLIENTNIPPLPIKRGSTFNFKYQLAGFIFEGKVKVDKVVPTSTYDFTTIGGITSTWKQSITPKGKGSKFSLNVSYEIPDNVLGKLKSAALIKLNEKDANQYLQNLKSSMEI